MKVLKIVFAGLIGLSACVPTLEEGVERGKPFDIEGTRRGDLAQITLVHQDGSAITPADEQWARARAAQVACVEGETAITDTFTITGNGALVQVFCAEVLSTNEEIDASGLRG